MAAAAAAAKAGAQVDLYEKNEKLGKKVYITGKGRCNITNDCEMETLFDAVCTNKKFLYSAFYNFTNQDVMNFFREQGLAIKTERGGRVFPVSDHSSDVIRTLERHLEEIGVRVHLRKNVKELIYKEEADEANVQAPVKTAKGIVLDDGKKIMADAVIVATGGLSYPSTGSTGDGYRFAKAAGHKIVDTSPSLVPFNTEGEDAPSLQGLSLKNVKVTIKDGKKVLYEDFGEMMFTHFGVTGPLILTASTKVQKKLKDHPLKLLIDLKPALDDQQLDGRFLREFEAGANKQFRNILGSMYPAKLIPLIIKRSGIEEDKLVHDITKKERQALLDVTRGLEFTITSLRGWNESIITRGGIAVKDVNPSTMESKIVKGLYFAGETLDLDAVTGGFNLQIAWSTGVLAGTCAAEG